LYRRNWYAVFIHSISSTPVRSIGAHIIKILHIIHVSAYLLPTLVLLVSYPQPLPPTIMPRPTLRPQASPLTTLDNINLLFLPKPPLLTPTLQRYTARPLNNIYIPLFPLPKLPTLQQRIARIIRYPCHRPTQWIRTLLIPHRLRSKLALELSVRRRCSAVGVRDGQKDRAVRTKVSTALRTRTRGGVYGGLEVEGGDAVV
jgi:hypothetical protein